MFTFLIWIIWRTWGTAETHSGYEVPWSPCRIVPMSSKIINKIK